MEHPFIKDAFLYMITINEKGDEDHLFRNARSLLLISCQNVYIRYGL